ncbi:hypothetical protein [Cardinium endosymbiont of Nabis limbatus]|uniref:hypothetical protein n=1 Tax=Cardinium endosymbiont of Nabis limbatus TaxID=3066217 RepID=UPI003AF40397
MRTIFYYCILMTTILGASNRVQATQKETAMQYNPQETRFLEEAEGKEALKWAKARTNKTEKFLKKTGVYKLVKAHTESICYDQRKYLGGTIRQGYVYNFWTDAKNPQGLWRRTLLKNYSKDVPKWEVLIDVDKLSKKLGKKVVFKGVSNCFHQPNLYLITMSFGGKDDAFFREWDLKTKDFVEKGF